MQFLFAPCWQLVDRSAPPCAGIALWLGVDILFGVCTQLGGFCRTDYRGITGPTPAAAAYIAT